MTFPTLSPASQTLVLPDGASVGLSTVVSSYVPAEPVTQMMLGGTSRWTSSAADVHLTDAAYGGAVPAVGRAFYPDALPPPPTNDRRWLGSFKQLNPAGVAYPTGYDEVYYKHEPEKLSAAALAQWHADMDGLVPLIPNLGICLMGWTFDPASGRNPDDYLVPGVVRLAVDIDGVSPDSAHPGYHAYATVIKNVRAFADRHGFKSVVAAEAGANRSPADPKGTGRVAWVGDTASQARDAGFRAFCLWEQAVRYPTSIFSTDAENAMAVTMFKTGPRP
jgi:hypothetical protein